MKNDRKKLRRLAKMMNTKNEILIPIVGGLLDLMDVVALPQDVDFLLTLGPEPHTVDEAARKTGLPREKALAYLDDLVKKGWIWPYTFANGDRGFELLPIVVGWFEMQLCHGREGAQEKAFARASEDLFNSLRKLNVFPLRPALNWFTRAVTKPYQTIGAIRPPDDPAAGRTVPVGQSLGIAAQTAGPTQYVSELIDRHGRDNAIVVLHCFCRQWRKFVDTPCRFHIQPETCVAVGPMANSLIEYGYGRRITRADALKILEEVSKAGAVHTLFHEKDDIRLPNIAVCNCCWDCCGVYGSYNRGLIPLYMRRFYRAEVTRPEKCKVCGKCVKHCPTNCIRQTEDRAVIAVEKCIGCGQCALQCPTSAIELIADQRDVLVPMVKKSEARIQIG
ncbi:MAG: 4Fe-4S binding protein [Thermodesulfobacteriota bacterium]